MSKMVSQRQKWKDFGAKEYICPVCKRDKGMLYLFPNNKIQFICFCGRGAEIDWIDKHYNFKKKEFSMKEITRKVKNE